jgi:hypothetical protein
MIRQTPAIAHPKNHYYSLTGLIPVKYRLFYTEHAVAGLILFETTKTVDFIRFELASGIDSKVGMILALLRFRGHPLMVICRQPEMSMRK